MQFARFGDAVGEKSENPLFDGEAFLTALVGNDEMRINEVTFRPGARTKWHTHSFTQVLIVTKGKGIAATENEEREIVPGDIALIPPNVRHWHGATDDDEFTHVSANTLGDTEW